MIYHAAWPAKKHYSFYLQEDYESDACIASSFIERKANAMKSVKLKNLYDDVDIHSLKQSDTDNREI